ncbi:unnamed protein product [Hydatigera taeniaeformis]|uniref:Protein kinase domain-containing protein n=1 Tax=Hydatigena taeniaeformis TaxID=6205 RepID=A0A0R3X5X0_HYDTA|nr:unnamed protein product [Hydatigera taeniaeformis]
MTTPTDQHTFMKDVQHLYRTIGDSTDGQASIVAVDEMMIMVALRPKSGYNAHAEFLLTVNCYGLIDLVKAILYIIAHPDYESPMYSFGDTHGPLQTAVNSTRLLAGLPVNGCRFPPNLAWCEWASANGCLPIEGSEEMRKDEAWMEQKEIFSRKVGKGVADSGDNLIADDKASTTDADTISASNSTVSDASSSFAKIRYSLDPDDEDFSWGSYEPRWSSFEVESQRILIWSPNNGKRRDVCTIFYFIEFSGTKHHRFDLGQQHNFLFIASVLRENQSHRESRQTSSHCPWHAFVRNPGISYHPPTTHCSSLDLDKMFAGKQSVMLFGRKGTNAFSVGLPFEGIPNDENLSRFSAANDNVEMENSLDYRRISRESDQPAEAEAQSEAEVFLKDEPKFCADESNNGSTTPSSSFVSSSTYSDEPVDCPTITECPECRFEFCYLGEPIDPSLGPLWKWIFRRTRWPIRLAPQQNVDLSLIGIQIPPWRVSLGRMMADICHFCTKNEDISNLVLLDPMALSPLSPLLNLMRHEKLLNPRLTGVLWMTPFDALSPFYHVPVPVAEQQHDCETNECQDGEGTYPTPTCLRFLTVAAFLTNWVAWFSRIESYATLGMSRFRPLYISDPMAACLLQPFSLGCGQAPLLDLWPMWLLRRLLTLSLRLSQLQIPFLNPNRPHLRHLFPFSDLDEI